MKTELVFFCKKNKLLIQEIVSKDGPLKCEACGKKVVYNAKKIELTDQDKSGDHTLRQTSEIGVET